jgi:hypothetical protein
LRASTSFWREIKSALMPSQNSGVSLGFVIW